jgi:hypothetical protein
MKFSPFPHTQIDGIKAFRPYLFSAVKQEVKDRIARGERGPTGTLEGSHWLKEAFRQAQITFLSGARHLRGRPMEALFDGEHVRPGILDARGAAMLQALFTTVSLEFHSLVNLELAGSKTFRFANALVEELAQTSSNVKAEYVHLPFSSCVFVIESRVAIEALHQFLTPNTPAPSEEMLSTPLTVFAHELEASEQTRGYPSLLFLVCHGDAKHQWGMAKRELLLDSSWTVEHALHTDWEKIHEHLDKPPPLAPGRQFSLANPEESQDIDDRVFFEDGLFFFRLLMNMILYVTSTDPDLVDRAAVGPDPVALARMPSKERRTHSREIERMAGLKVVEAGTRLTPLVIDPRASAAEPLPHIAPGRIGRYSVRFKVRGGWRFRRVGPGRKEVKIVWVREHWKGPEMAELVRRHYEVR